MHAENKKRRSFLTLFLCPVMRIVKRPQVERKYILFHTGKAALFLFYSLVFLLLFLFYAKFTQEVPQANLVGGSILCVLIIVFYAFRIDRTLHMKSK